MKIGILSNNPARAEAVMRGCAGHRAWMIVEIEQHWLARLDLMIVAGWPEILKPDVFNAPKYGTWNAHAGPVPEYRGGSPLNWQIIDGKELLCVSLLKMDEGIDTGGDIDSAWFRLGPDETIREAHERANAAFTRMVRRCLNDYWPPNIIPQPDSDAYRPQRNDDMGEIDLTWEPARIHDFVRALTHPYPGAWIDCDGTRLRIWETSVD